MRLFRLLPALALCWPALPAPPPAKPKLVVVVVVDQFRYDYLTRFRQEYQAGFAKMLEGGAVFTNAHYLQAPTVTAVGHSIVMTGAMPAVSGIAGNAWFDRASGMQVTSVCDYRFHLLGAKTPPRGASCTDADPASPDRLEVSTVGDELRNRHPDSKVVGISLKARSAILPGGHRANGAYWFDDNSGGFVSSNFYFDGLPEWVKEFNGRKLADAYLDRSWEGFPTWNFHSTNASRRYERLPASPWGNELIESMAEAAIHGERLGQRGSTDLLAVSFSSNDYVGHQTGPDSPEVHDMCLRTDRLLGKLMDAAERAAGAGNATFVLTADHGVAPLPAVQEKRKMPGGYIHADSAGVVNQALSDRFGSGDWVAAGMENVIYLNWKTVGAKKISRAEVMRVAAEALLATPALHAARVYTRDQLLAGVCSDPIGQAITYGFNAGRSGDLVIVQEPYWLFGTKGTSHSTPYEYDRHVPVIFYGAGIRPGRHVENIAVNDIAPTLASLLEIEPPSGSSGHVLRQVE